jgi:hypothetical protein
VQLQQQVQQNIWQQLNTERSLTATARLESAKLLKENQHRTASNTKLSLQMEGDDHGTTRKVIQWQHTQRSDTQAVRYKMSYDDIQSQARRQLQKS